MDRVAPKHIFDYCVEDSKDSTYMHMKNKYEDNYSFAYKIKCSCGNEKFIVFEDLHPSIYCKCIKCNKNIIVYDLQYYPAAIKLNCPYERKEIRIHNETEFLLYVVYEYSNEFEEKKDVEFDQDDITWAKVFIKGNSCFEMILDDETA